MHACFRSRVRPQVLVPALLAFAALALVTPAHASGPIGFTAFGGLYSGGLDEGFLGAGVRFGLGSLALTPNAEYVFVNEGSAYTLNADFTMPVVPLGVASIYAGAGAGVLIRDVNGNSDSNSVVNLLAGAGLNAVPMKPYGQIKYVITDGEDPFVFSVGVRF